MPTAKMTVLSNNDLIITFNDTLFINTIEQSDLSLKVYGPEASYSFTWTAIFDSNSSVYINNEFLSSLQGSNQEQIVLSFKNTEKFVSIYSKRGVNPTDLSDFLFAYTGSQASSSSFGQTTMIVFLFSIGISAISSFGGNSMEMMWNLMNTLQLLFYLSYIYVNYPDNVESFFTYLKYSNADNEYLKFVSFKIIPESNFKRGNVNNRIGEKAFYVNSADKIPMLILILFAFLLTITLGSVSQNNRGRFMRLVLKLLDFLKYNFFIRFCMEMFLDMTFTSLINIYWYDVSSWYEVFSLCLAILFI
mmetsp:Transcript_41597/g.48010  ORF Transcript_41597/g.48010 Transcript_41597/m.48010 type:complete len:304 (-) Transcript_41597:430-1341(-)